jgi:predicted RNA binding protein YcfA (HicA-like mRNA interferase family)
MGHWKKTLERVMSGRADADIRYDDLCQLLGRLGYAGRQSGSHHIFRRASRDLINLQNSHGKAKAYQVRQVREQLQKFQP